jgi:hypothetical protein
MAGFAEGAAVDGPPRERSEVILFRPSQTARSLGCQELIARPAMALPLPVLVHGQLLRSTDGWKGNYADLSNSALYCHQA